jgi:peptidyl-prolyl cis-trans isomerase A (cyclophilin A)/peptidyl-prolyl cis-trans isomerase-like 1
MLRAWAVLLFLTSGASLSHAAVLARMTTSHGPIEITLYADKAPKTVSNFIELARKGFYDGVTFHRIVPGFVIQGGDPMGTGAGGPGYCFQDEIVDGLTHSKAGILSMANSGPDTNGSQFFITLAATPHLDRKHTVFGEVTGGMDTVTKIAATKSRELPQDPKAVQKIVIQKVEIVGDFKPVAFTKVTELTSADLEKLLQPKVAELAASIGRTANTTRTGKFVKASMEQGRTKCAEAQAIFNLEYEKSAKAKLVVYGRTEGKSFEVSQLQWGLEASDKPAKHP